MSQHSRPHVLHPIVRCAQTCLVYDFLIEPGAITDSLKYQCALEHLINTLNLGEWVKCVLFVIVCFNRLVQID